MKITMTLLAICLFSFNSFSQTEDLKKIEKNLQQSLVGSSFLGGIYSPPCYNIKTIKTNSAGEIEFTGEEKGCNITIYIKNANLNLNGNKLRISQSEPKINLTLYTENGTPALQALEDLKKILNK